MPRWINFDTAATLALMKKSASGGTTQGNAIRGRESGYESRHYVIEDPSDSLEYSASDFAIAQFARTQGDTATYNSLMTRAQWWINTWNPESAYVSRHNGDGTFTWPVDPASDAGYTEGNPAQYTWMVTYNFQGLVNLMGGRPTTVQRLNHHFTQVNGGLTTPFFYIGNEPEHGVPWAYNFAGAPAGTADAVHKVMSDGFNTAAGGLPGNDDLGATSAWYVWASMGLYPATPGADTLALHGPSFPSILVQRPTGNVTITASGSGPYVQGLSVNGSSTTHNFIRYPDLASGGTLAYTMGGSPSGWGTGTGDVPPSFNDGFTPPPTAPNLGTNLAQGKPTTASPPCAASESSDKAVDGSLAGNSKWCSLTASAFLQVDLGSTQNVSSFVVKHAGLGGETTGWNTGAYTIATSTDGTNFTTAVTKSGMRSSRTLDTIPTRSARYVRLTTTTPTNNGNNAARIYELEVYGGSGPTNVALNKAATADSQCNTNEGPAKAFNGSVSGGNSDKWCSGSANRFLQVDLGQTFSITSFTLRNAGAGGESSTWNTKDADIQVSTDGTNFTTVAQIRGNTANVTDVGLATPVTGRYVRLNVITPTGTTDAAARIYEFEVYA